MTGEDCYTIIRLLYDRPELQREGLLGMESQYMGGQALIEGVMMRCGDTVALAVRKPDRSIHVETSTRIPWRDRFPLFSLPVIRGKVVLIESAILGYEMLNRSANLSGDEEEEMSTWQMAGTLLFSLGLALALFVLLPVYLAEWLTGGERGSLFAGIEGVLRLGLFLLYIWLISRVRDIQRVFQYHGAEHKAINCYEAGMTLTVEHVRRQSLVHKRCGTSFLLFVMLISILVFSFFSAESLSHLELIGWRLVLMPIIAGLSYELIRWAGSSDNRVLTWVVSPGLLLQKMTTAEPDDAMIEVAIASVEAVLSEKIAKAC